MKVKIVVFVPVENADEVREVVGKAGGGRLGEYSFCSYTVTGTGRFLPSDRAKPHIGKVGKLEQVKEERIEITCDQTLAKKVVEAIKAVHPYEEVALDIYPLLTTDEL
jgi:hypothetical protein